MSSVRDPAADPKRVTRQLTAASSPQQVRRQVSLRKTLKAGPFAKLFLQQRSKNPKFTDDVELAARGAFFTLLLALPLLLPHGYSSKVDWLTDNGVHTSANIAFTLFSFYKTTGETLELLFSGTLGVFIAASYSWLLLFIFPGGVTSDSSPAVFATGAIAGGLFLVVVFFLNLHPNTQVFACSIYVFHKISFLQPGYYHAEWADLIGALCGAAFAILATLVPYPLLAIWKAQDSAAELVAMLRSTWNDLADYYCAPQRNIYSLQWLKRDVDDFKEKLNALPNHIANSWWETAFCFASPIQRWRRSRTMLKHLGDVLEEASDRLFSVRTACVAEGFEDSHLEVMGKLRPAVNECLATSGELMSLCTDIAVRGGDLAAEGSAADSELEARLRGTRRSMAQLSAELKAARKEAGADVWQELVEEHAFCLNVCAWCRLVADYADALLEANEKPFPALDESAGSYFQTVFDTAVIFRRSRVAESLRCAVKVLVGFWIGFSGDGGTLRQYDADIASTICIMLQTFQGSSVAKNLHRLQGVVIGTVAGHVFHEWFSRCTHWFQLAKVILILSWTAGSLFLYFHFAAAVGLYLAVSGVDGLVVSCGTLKDQHAHFVGSYHKFANIFIALLVIILVDECSLSPRAHKLAHQKYKELWDDVRKSVEAFLDQSSRVVKPKRGPAVSLAVAVRGLGLEAAKEPRLWRGEFKHGLFIKGIDGADALRMHLHNTAYSMAVDDRLHQKLLMKKSFHHLGQLLLNRFDVLEKLFCAFSMEEDIPLRTIEKLEAWRDPLDEWKVAMKSFIQEAEHSIDAGNVSSEGSLEDDEEAQLSVCVASLNNIMMTLRALQAAFLEE